METTSALRQFRTTEKLSLDDLAGKLDVDKATLSRWERGQIPAERCRDVERVTGVPRQLLRPDLFEGKVA